MKALLVGNCILENLSDILQARGHENRFIYIANPVTLLYSDGIPEGLANTLQELGIEDRLEKRTLTSQFGGLSEGTEYDVVFVNYYHELRPLLRHRKEKYFLHLNYQAIKDHEPAMAWEWVSRNFDVVDTDPNKYLHRLTGLIFKIRRNFPQATIILINKFYPVHALGPIAMWYCTEGRPFDTEYLNEMEQWANQLMLKDPGIFLFHTENILIDLLNKKRINFQFVFPEIYASSRECTRENYTRDLEHPSELFYDRLADYAERIIRCCESGDMDRLSRICRIQNEGFWRRFIDQDFRLSPMTKDRLHDLFQDKRDTCQMVALENTLPFEEYHLAETDSLFTENLKETRRFLKLKNNFRTVFRISPRKSLLPALELFLEYFKELDRVKEGKHYYSMNVQDFEHMHQQCRHGLSACF